MHYRNGREAQNGDIVVQLDHAGAIVGVGVLYKAKPGNDYCNGYVAPIQNAQTVACLADCLHADDVGALIANVGLANRAAGK